MTRRGSRLRGSEGVALLAVLGLTILILGLAGATLGLFTVKARRARAEADRALGRQIIGDSLGLSTAGLGTLITLAPKQAPQAAFFFQGADLDGNRILSRAGEIRQAPNGEYRRVLVDARGTPVRIAPDPNLVPTFDVFDEDVGEDGVPDELENLYDPILRPDPSRDNYHPLFNPKGTEGNGKQDANESDVNGNLRFDVEEDASRRWMRSPGRLKGILDEERDKSDGLWGIRARDVNDGLDINGPEIVTARLLNNLFRLLDIREGRTNGAGPGDPNSYPEKLGYNGRGFEASPQLDFLLRGGNIRLVDGAGNPVPIQRNDPHAVRILKARRSLPGQRFASLEQLLEICGPRHLGILKLPATYGHVDPADPNNPTDPSGPLVDVASDIDEFQKLAPLISFDAIRRKSLIRRGREAGNVGIEMRAPLPINTAPLEMIAAAVMAAFEPQLIPLGSTLATDMEKAAMFFSRTLVNFRLGIPFASRPTGLDRARPGPFRNQEDLEQFMVDLRSWFRTGVGSPQRNDFILRNFDNIVIQFSENQVFQGLIPDRVEDAPLDKTSLRLSFSSPSLTYHPMGTFLVEAESRIHTRARPLADNLFSTRELIRVGGSSLGGFRPRDYIQGVGGVMEAHRYEAVVKTAEILHHTLQEDFEGEDGRQATHANTRSWPERLTDDEAWHDVSFAKRWIAQGNITGMAFDEDRGIVYFLNETENKLFALPYGSFDPSNPAAIEPVVIAGDTSDPFVPLPGSYLPGPGNFLELDPHSMFGELGRLYMGRRGGNRIFVYDLTATVPEGMPILPIRRPDIDLRAAPISDHPQYSAAVGNARLLSLIPYPDGRGFFLVTERNRRSVTRFAYTRADNRAKPEEDDPSTPEDERFDGIDNDRDGVVDDRPGMPHGTPEGNVYNRIDDDGDGVADDGAERGLTAPMPLLPALDTGLNGLPTAWTYDPIFNQFLITQGTVIQRLRGFGLGSINTSNGAGMATGSVAGIHRKSLNDRLSAGETITHLALEPGSSVYVVTFNPANNLSRLLRLAPERLSFEDDIIVDAVSPVESIAVDPVNHLILLTGQSKILAVRERGSLLAALGTTDNVGFQAEVRADPRREIAVAVARNPGQISLYNFHSWPYDDPAADCPLECGNLVNCYRSPVTNRLVHRRPKHLDKGGRVKLAPRSSQDSPQGDKQFLAKADFDDDIHLRRPGLTRTYFEEHVDALRAPPGQVIRFRNPIRKDIFKARCLPSSVFDEEGVFLTPDGLMTFADNRPGSSLRAVQGLRYDPVDIYGKGALLKQSRARGLRIGGVGFWMKLDGLGFGPGGGLAIDPADPPRSIDVFRMYHRVRIDPFLFLNQDDKPLNFERELERFLGQPRGSIHKGSIKFRPPLPWYQIEIRINLSRFQDDNANGDIDSFLVRCLNHLDLVQGDLQVSYQLQVGNNPDQSILVEEPFDPIAQNADISPRPNRLLDNRVGGREPPPRRVQVRDGGEWLHFLTLWGSGFDTYLNQEKVHGRFYINGRRMSHVGRDLPFDPAAHKEKNRSNGIDDDGDGAVDDGENSVYGLPEDPGLRRNLLDDDGDGVVDDGYTSSPPFMTLGVIPDQPRLPTFVMKAIVDDFVIYPNEKAFIRNNETAPRDIIPLRRFRSRGETLDEDPDAFCDEGEPFIDINGNSIYDGVVTGFYDRNGNGLKDADEPDVYDGTTRSYFDRNGDGVHDAGEPYQGMYPFDFGERIPGEPYYDFNRSGSFDGTDFDLDLGRDLADNIPTLTADFYEDQNGNGRFDGGESYTDLLGNRGWTAPEPFFDQNFNGSLDGPGKFVRGLDYTLMPGDRVAWMAWDGLTPEGTQIWPELVLRSLGGQELGHFFGDRRARNTREVGMLATEPSRLQYRMNFMVSRNEGIYEPFRAGDGVARSFATGDDVQLVQVGARVTNGQRIVGPGLNEVIDSIPAGGDRWVPPYQSPILESVTVAVLIEPQILRLTEMRGSRRDVRVNVRRP